MLQKRFKMKTGNFTKTALSAIVIGLTIIMIGCDNGYDCALNNTSYDNIGFYTKENNSEEEYIFPETLTVSLMVNGKESIVVNHIIDADRISLPMSYTQEVDTVIFRYSDALEDSLYITHTNNPYYQSMECGTVMYHKLEELKYTNVWIESADIVNNNVNFEGHENIKIYFYK